MFQGVLWSAVVVELPFHFNYIRKLEMRTAIWRSGKQAIECEVDFNCLACNCLPYVTVDVKAGNAQAGAASTRGKTPLIF